MVCTPEHFDKLPEELAFGKHRIRKSEVFAASESSFCFVNLRPLVPGHVLVSPQRVCPRFKDLTADEVSDLWRFGQHIAGFIEDFFKADSMSLVIQDGPAAGQTVPHVHIHILPRHFGDLEHNDEIYDMINDASKAEDAARLAQAKTMDLDQQVVVKTLEEMAAEALRLRTGLADWNAQKQLASASS